MDRSRVEMVRGYAETTRCRTRFLLGYFGERLDHGCGHCDRCEQGPREESAPPRAAYDVGTAVVHATFGRGAVVDLTEDEVTVLFDDEGYRTLRTDIVEEKDLLDPV